LINHEGHEEHEGQGLKSYQTFFASFVPFVVVLDQRTNRLTPSFNNLILKLISKPVLRFASFK